jgi:hypothetical protein
MAGSAMTFEYDDGDDGAGRRCSIRRVIATFLTDDSAGTASGTTRKIVGELIKVVTNPGSAAPTDNWDVLITDENSIDPLAGVQNAAALVARDTTTTEQTYLQLLNADGTPVAEAIFPVVCGALTIAVANGGNSKTGEIILYYRP